MAQNAVSPSVQAPTEPGFYKYSGGRQNMIFLLCHERLLRQPRVHHRWYVISDNATMVSCEWDYIEQALSVWDLERIE